jgi:hypothetical protein
MCRAIVLHLHASTINHCVHKQPPPTHKPFQRETVGRDVCTPRRAAAPVCRTAPRAGLSVRASFAPIHLGSRSGGSSFWLNGIADRGGVASRHTLRLLPGTHVPSRFSADHRPLCALLFVLCLFGSSLHSLRPPSVRRHHLRERTRSGDRPASCTTVVLLRLRSVCPAKYSRCFIFSFVTHHASRRTQHRKGGRGGREIATEKEREETQRGEGRHGVVERR